MNDGANNGLAVGIKVTGQGHHYYVGRTGEIIDGDGGFGATWIVKFDDGVTECVLASRIRPS